MGGSASTPRNGSNNRPPEGGGREGRDECPKKLKAIVAGPAPGIVTGTLLNAMVTKPPLGKRGASGKPARGV
jgi:hypothetical protein